MLFVAILRATSPTSERAARRLDYTFPEGITVVAEYWLQTNDPAVIVALETDDPATLMAITMAWDDLFDISYFPAITAEAGLPVLRERMGGATPG